MALMGPRIVWQVAQSCCFLGTRGIPGDEIHPLLREWRLVCSILLVQSLSPSLFQVFVVMVILLTSSVVVIVYVCLLPLVLQTYPIAWVFWHFIYGHWNLVMIIFHYYMAITTQPGCPPKVGRGIIVLFWPLLLFMLRSKAGLLSIISFHFLSVVTPVMD